ncbi:cupin domain-containing [Fusarium sporotrichioides]|uniref:Cupin domain-containing n=1 Tax=Fusarium sporotrichioides TaxID=5514 RepID=A0A395RTX5_FUSSP|nr:cupin domain-containing [Fusarium sporotrichioides]
MADHQLPVPKRFITVHNHDGNAIFNTQLDDEMPTNNLTNYNFHLGYVTRGVPVDLTSDSDIKTYQSYITGPPRLALLGGSVLRFVDLPPGGGDMYRTLSIDYGVVLEGEMKLVLDSGESRVLKRGDVVVQRGTMHQWVNTDREKWARMMFVLQESKPVKVASNGVGLEEDGRSG